MDQWKRANNCWRKKIHDDRAQSNRSPLDGRPLQLQVSTATIRTVSLIIRFQKKGENFGQLWKVVEIVGRKCSFQLAFLARRKCVVMKVSERKCSLARSIFPFPPPPPFFSVLLTFIDFHLGLNFCDSFQWAFGLYVACFSYILLTSDGEKIIRLIYKL